MPENLSIEQIALIAAVGAGAVIGLFRGLSGGLGSVCGIAAAVAAGWFLFEPVASLIDSRGWLSGDLERRGATIVADGLIGLIAFGAARKLIERFVRFLVPRTLDALLGAAAGGAAGYVVWRAGRWALEFFLQGGGDALQGAVAA